MASYNLSGRRYEAENILVFILLGWNSISVASLIIESIYLGLVGWMSTIADFSGCSRQICQGRSFNLVLITQHVCPM
jgi:hypothetical protein